MTITFPDDSGQVLVQGVPGAFEPGASVLVVNNTNGIVVTGTVSADGFELQIRAAISDELQIRILDSSDRELVIDKTEFRAEDGSVAIGRLGGSIEQDDILLDVPEGAIPVGAGVFKLTPLTQEAIDQLPLPEGAGGKGAAVQIDMGGVTLEKEAELSLPLPPDAPDDAEFIIVREVQEQNVTLYEVIDSASVEDEKVTTDSFPFVGVVSAGVAVAIWYVATQTEPDLPPKNPLGVITGIARETDGRAEDPTIKLLSGVRVQATDKLLLPNNGDYVATSDKTGRFVLFDFNFGSTGAVELTATHGSLTESATAFENTDVRARFSELDRYNQAGNVVFNFPLTAAPEPAGDVDIKLFRMEGSEEIEVKNGLAVVGQELTVRVSFTKPADLASLDINDISVDLARIDPFLFEVSFTPRDARAYNAVVSAVDAFRNTLFGKKSFLAVDAGAGNDKPLPGPPSIISDASVPRTGETGVAVSETFRIRFTEPVTNVSTTTVTLQEVGGSSVLLRLVAFDLDTRQTGDVDAASVLADLTILPQQGLKFGANYELRLSGDILDTDSPTSLSSPTRPLSISGLSRLKCSVKPIHPTYRSGSPSLVIVPS